MEPASPARGMNRVCIVDWSRGKRAPPAGSGEDAGGWRVAPAQHSSFSSSLNSLPGLK